MKDAVDQVQSVHSPFSHNFFCYQMAGEARIAAEMHHDHGFHELAEGQADKSARWLRAVIR
jgi:hypothetical protein